jgi:protein-disulfide isomerase
MLDQVGGARRWRTFSFGLIAFGWLLSGYLLLRMAGIGGVRLPWHPAISAGALCSGCDEALASASSSFHGFPLAGLGLAYFALLGFVLAIGGVWATRTVFLVVAAGAGVSVTLSSALFSGATSVCVPCLLVHAANLGLMAALFVLVSRQATIEDRQPPPLLSRKAWALIAVVTMATSALLEAAMVRPGVDARKIIAAYRSAPMFDITPETGDAVLGQPNGRVRLVVFSSFQCPWCQVFAPILHRLSERYSDNLTIVFKNYPLGKDCNPALAGDMQPRACAAAWAAEAAHLQKSFWHYHDSLFSYSLQASEEILRATARGAGLDLEQWDRDRASQSVQSKVARDVELGMRLGVDGTPVVFLDGRRVKDLSLPVLDLLIRQEIKGSI